MVSPFVFHCFRLPPDSSTRLRVLSLFGYVPSSVCDRRSARRSIFSSRSSSFSPGRRPLVFCFSSSRSSLWIFSGSMAFPPFNTLSGQVLLHEACKKREPQTSNPQFSCALLFHPDQPFAFSPLAAGSLSYAGFLARDSSSQAPSHRFDNGNSACLSSHTVVGPHRLCTGFPLSRFLPNRHIRRF